MPLRFNPRIERLEPFLAMEVMERAFEMERAGADVIHLEVGEPCVPPPPEAVEACTRALAEGETRYTDSRGLPELREAIAEEHSRRSGARVGPERVIVTSGTSPAMLLVFALLIEPGDEVILGTPHYACYPNFIRFCGGEPVFVPTGPGDDWQLDPAAVRAAIGPRTRAIVVASPANPTGAVQERAALEEIAALGVPLISDEVYQGLTYDGAEAVSALSLGGTGAGDAAAAGSADAGPGDAPDAGSADAGPGDALDAGSADAGPDVFLLDGFSKRYAMTGFRLGYAVVPPAALRPLQVMQQNLFISANRFVQHAGVAALRHGEPMVRKLRDRLDERRRRIVPALRELGFEIASAPRGAFYVFADARRFGADSRALAFEILERAHVACTPGVDFGSAGEGFLRFSYSASEEALDEALTRLARALPELG